MPFEWKAQHDFDLHIALEVEPPILAEMLAKGKAQGIETRGISEHGFARSIYFRDPNGYRSPALGTTRRAHWSTLALRASVFARGAARRAHAFILTGAPTAFQPEWPTVM